MMVALVRVLSTDRSMSFVSFIQSSVDIPEVIFGPRDSLSEVYWQRRTLEADPGHKVAYERTVKLLNGDALEVVLRRALNW